MKPIRTKIEASPQSRGLVVRLLTIPIGTVSALSTAHFALQYLGPAEYGAATIIIALPMLLPFLDLGLGASVMNAAANVESSSALSWTFRRSFAILCGVSTSLFVAALFISSANAWTILVGPAVAGQLLIGGPIAVAGFAISIPLSLGHRLLLGFGRADLSAAIYAVQPMILGALSAIMIPVLPTITCLMVALAVSSVSGGVLAILVGRRIADQHLVRESDGETGKLFSIAGPVLLMSVATPVTFQSGRWMLAQQSDSSGLAAFALLLQVFIPLCSAAYSFGSGMYPGYRKPGVDKRTTLLKNLRQSILVGFILAVLNVAGGIVAFATVGQSIGVSPLPSIIALSLALLFWTISQPAAMLLSNPRLYWVQAVSTILMMALVWVFTASLLDQGLSYFSAALALPVAILLGSTIPVVIVSHRVADRVEFS